MVQLFADGCFALEAIEEDRIGFHVGMGNFQRDDAIVAHVGGAKDRCHAAAGDGRFDAVGVDLRAGFNGVEKAHRAVILQCCMRFFYSIEESSAVTLRNL